MKRALLPLLLLVAAPSFGSFGWVYFNLTESDLPATCTASRPYWIVDGASSTDCTTGSGSTVVQCICNTDGTSYTGRALSGGGGGAPTDADYLVGTINGTLSAEIVVGTSPGGELGGTWASPTVDATHSGSAHHTVFSPNADPSVDHSSYVAGHSNGANCAAGSYPLGVDAAGAVEGCTVAGSGGISVEFRTVNTTFVNTTAATSVLTGTVPADALGSNGTLRFEVHGSYFNNSGAAQSFTVSVDFGATTLYSDVTAALGTSATRRGTFTINGTLTNLNATGSQGLGGYIAVNHPAATNTGHGNLGTDEIAAQTPIAGTSSEDTTGALTFAVKITPGAAHVLYSFVAYVGIAEVL